MNAHVVYVECTALRIGVIKSIADPAANLQV